MFVDMAVQYMRTIENNVANLRVNQQSQINEDTAYRILILGL